MKEPAPHGGMASGPDAASPADDVRQLLRAGTITLQGLLPWSSNYTFLGTVSHGGLEVRIVYKPVRGERPLWDFPASTLARREVAAYVVSAALGWGLVPPTVLRDGPHGMGSVQLFVDADPDAHYFTFHSEPIYQQRLRSLALFDVIINNADRKGGHCLCGDEGAVWAIDHGVCFHCDPKLRTVIWEYAGEDIDGQLAADILALSALLDQASAPAPLELRFLLSPAEYAALQQRVRTLIDDGHFPSPPDDRRVIPWPLV
jgi:uncharacterized repeat protein (TIGR03843 family)